VTVIIIRNFGVLELDCEKVKRACNGSDKLFAKLITKLKEKFINIDRTYLYEEGSVCDKVCA
jgi:hypothetical protein